MRIGSFWPTFGIISYRKRRCSTSAVSVFFKDCHKAARLVQAGPKKGDLDSIDHESGNETKGGIETIVRPKQRTRPPSLYTVLLLNDDYTPMEFVVHVLQKFFQKEYNEANRIMLQVHHQGAGIAGVFPHEIAETKVYIVNQYARQNHHPLKCTMEKA